MIRTALAAAAALALCACAGHDRPVGAQPTPLSVKGPSGEGQPAATPERENMRIQGPHSSAADAGELSRDGKSCTTDADCSGRLRCVSYYGVAGRELKQCLFPCADGCPAGYTCQLQMPDGPINTCSPTR